VAARRFDLDLVSTAVILFMFPRRFVLVVTFGARHSNVIERKYKAYVTKTDRFLTFRYFPAIFFPKMPVLSFFELQAPKSFSLARCRSRQFHVPSEFANFDIGFVCICPHFRNVVSLYFAD
jgi:hypothetical protein